jgi:hypothetical protein
MLSKHRGKCARSVPRCGWLGFLRYSRWRFSRALRSFSAIARSFCGEVFRFEMDAQKEPSRPVGCLELHAGRCPRRPLAPWAARVGLAAGERRSGSPAAGAHARRPGPSSALSHRYDGERPDLRPRNLKGGGGCPALASDSLFFSRATWPGCQWPCPRGSLV